jgi:hypothetical protein
LQRKQNKFSEFTTSSPFPTKCCIRSQPASMYKDS